MYILTWTLFLPFLTSYVWSINVEKTVQHVQTILQQNTQLPRLTRDEIIQLLNDIHTEDSKKTKKQDVSSSNESIITTKQPSTAFTTVPQFTTETPDLINNEVIDNIKNIGGDYEYTKPESTTNRNKQTLTVVLPYTPRDGSSLQELYTKPPRVTVVPEVATEKSKVGKEGFKDNKYVNRNKPNVNQIPGDLQKFMETHGLNGYLEQDHFLLPLEGFKPLPPIKVVDDTVELPENILLTYDIISTGQKKEDSNNLKNPKKSELPFELESSASEAEKIVLPATSPNVRKTKQADTEPVLEPLDYDSIKVLPLEKLTLDESDKNMLDLNKRQTENSTNNTGDAETTVAPSLDSKLASTNVGESSSDSGASIADLEDSFGGAAQTQPGDSELPPPKKNGFYWMVDWNSFLEVGDGDTKVNIRFEPKLGDPQMFLPVNVP